MKPHSKKREVYGMKYVRSELSKFIIANETKDINFSGHKDKALNGVNGNDWIFGSNSSNMSDLQGVQVC